MAGSTHWLAAQTALAMLEQGGNAFDAAVAAGFVLQVAEPHLNGPLGEVPILFHHAGSGQSRLVCGQGPAPRAATLDAFAALDLDRIPGTGVLAAAIPGAFDAWMLLLRDYGSLQLAAVLEPAMFYARTGVPVLPRLSRAIGAMTDWFRTEWPANAELYLPDGTPPAPGSWMRNPALADTWARTLHQAERAGPDRGAQIDAARQVWKTGAVATCIAEFCQRERVRDVTGRKHQGLLHAGDLAGWSASYEDPVCVDTFGHRIHKCGPWSQGPVLLQGLQIIAHLDRDTLQDPAGFIHALTETMKLCYADRDTFYGDPNFVAVPLEQLLSDDYARARAARISPSAATGWHPGDIEGHGHPVDYEAACRVNLDADALAAMGIGEPTVATHATPAHGDTCHINVADRWGNLVAATPSGGWLASSPVIPELGAPLGTRLQMMRLTPDAPDCLMPGKRPRTTLTPTLLSHRDGSGYMACGTPGGDKQDQWQLAFLVRHLALGLTPQMAIEAPSFYSMHWPDSFYPRKAYPARLHVEGRVPVDARDRLRAQGHDLVTDPDWSDNYLSASYRTRDGTLGAASSPRGQQAYAVGR